MPVEENQTPEPLLNDDALLASLISRGRQPWKTVDLSPENVEDLVERIVRDFNDGVSALSGWYDNQVELVKNWEMIVEPKKFPYEDAANIQVPFTSSQTQQHAARIVKALIGGDKVTTFEALDESLDQEALDEANQWFQWELDEVVDFRHAIERIVQQTLIAGISLPVPYWKKERRQLLEFHDFTYDPSKPILDQIQTVIDLIFDGKEVEVTSQPSPGIYNLSVKDPNEDKPDRAKIAFAIRNNRLSVKVDKVETIFEGVKIEIHNTEDMCFINTHPDLERLPFVGFRIWEDAESYREGLQSGRWMDLGDERNGRILATGRNKTPQIVPIEYTQLQDVEEGTDSTDSQAVTYERRFIEIYRWEGWIHPENTNIDSQGEESAARVLEPAVQVAAWIVPMAKELIRICRLEELNKDGKRSPVKFGFIERMNRFLPIGIVEWLRHVQAELSGIHNLRIDAATLLVMPFGFYKPLAGMSRDVLDIIPGKLYPTPDPASVNFPRPNGNPTWNFNDEALVRKYGNELSGLGDSQLGSFISKRQSASEYMGTANAVDLRSEQIINGYLRSLRELLYKIVGLYQQFAPPERIFQVGGEDGLRVVKRFKTDRLQGKLLLRLTGNLDQINPQLQRDVAVNMLSLLMNQIMIQVGIVKPRTIYEAITHVAKAMNYKGVKLFKPDYPETSPNPNIENKMMVAGQDVQPHLDENFNEHLMAHQKFLIDEETRSMITPLVAQRVLKHIQETQRLQQIAVYLRQQESLQAVAMAKNMASMGIRPGMAGGQQVGDQAKPGTAEEGVSGAEPEAA